MKPTKNRVFCPAARKLKMVFDSKPSALTFIKFNAETILEENGYAPTRAYFCSACGAWHVTHQEIDEESVNKKLNPLKEETDEHISKLSEYFNNGDYDSVYKNAISVHFSVEGYLKLANHLSASEHAEHGEEVRCKLEDILYDSVCQLSDYAESVYSEGNIKDAIPLLSKTIRMANSARGIIRKSDKRFALLCDKVLEMRNTYNEWKNCADIAANAVATKRLIRKIESYITKIDEFTSKREFINASKQIHFATMHLRHHSQFITPEVEKFIDVLIEKKKAIPEEYTEVKYFNL